MNLKEFWNFLGTAFASLSDDSKEKIEGIWALVIDYLSDLNTKLYFQQFNWSINTAPPYYFQSEIFYSDFYFPGGIAKTFDLPKNIITSSIVLPDGTEFTHNDTIFSTEDSAISIETGKTYVLTDSGFTEDHNLWGPDGYAV